MRSLPRGRAADRRATILRGSESRSTPPCAAPIRRVAPLEPLANVLLYRRARRLANRAELGIGLPCGPAIAFGEPAAKPIIERQVVDRARPIPCRKIGRALWMASVCPFVWSSGVAVNLKKKKEAN